MLQRQNSVPVSQPPHQLQQKQQLNNDYYKPNNTNKPPFTSASGQQQQPDFQRKYSLPTNTTAPMQQLSTSSSLSYAPLLSNIIRKQSAPTLTQIPTRISNVVTVTTAANVQQSSNFQQVAQGSPSRARDRNLFEKVPSSIDVMQLAALKGYSTHLCVYRFNFIVTLLMLTYPYNSLF